MECQRKLHPGVAQARGTGEVSRSPPAAKEVAVTPIYVRSDRAAGWGRTRVGGIQHHLTWNENTNKPLFPALAF